MASLFALSFLEREKKDLPPLDCRAFLSLDENIAAAGECLSAGSRSLSMVCGWPFAHAALFWLYSLARVTSSSCLQHPACSLPSCSLPASPRVEKAQRCETLP